MEIVTAYTPVHSHAKTITYRVEVDTHCWERFFTREEDLKFLELYAPTGTEINPKDEASMKALHLRIQAGQGPFYLGAADIAQKKLTDSLLVYMSKSKMTEA
jgi:hypothetical protein